MKTKNDAEIIRAIDEERNSCFGCSYFARDYEDNDIWCNCRKSRYYKDVPPDDPCSYWRPKE